MPLPFTQLQYLPHTAGIHTAVLINGTENIPNTHKTLLIDPDSFCLADAPLFKGQLCNPDILNWSNFKVISRKDIPERRYQGYPASTISMVL